VVERIAAPALQVIRGEDASDETNDREAELSVIRDRIDIPPGIAARRNRAVESRSFSKVAAASRPDKAAIGTPAPGWVLPPAQ
jgi:hypothetical protein